jgi:hypothetical protein
MTRSLRLPTFEFEGEILIKRIALVIHQNAKQVLDWILCSPVFGSN